MKKITEKFLKYYPLVALGLITLVLCYLFYFKELTRHSIALISIIAGSIYFIQKHQLEKMKLFKQLFTEFNARYDNLNDKLIKIIDKSSDETLAQQEKIVIIDYFNLCAEEYFFYKHGCILCEVWEDWRNGIKEKFNSKRIKDLWEVEKGNNSYYGLNKIL